MASIERTATWAVKAFVLATSLITLLLVWVIYSQVAVLHLYRQRWKGSGTESGPEEHPDRTAGAEDETVIETGSLAPANPEIE
jgi:hypothetical protein